MRSTHKFDRAGKEIFEGDKVIMAWGWGRYQGAEIIRYRIHTITVKPAHMMANGKMHDDGGGIIFCLGKAYNFWTGDEVTKLSQEGAEYPKIGEDKDFFIQDGQPVLFTDQHFMDMTDEEYKAYKDKRDSFLIWGKHN